MIALLLFFGLLLIRRQPLEIGVLFFLSLSYGLFLMLYVNYRVQPFLDVDGSGINGRYLFPVLPALAISLSALFTGLLRGSARKYFSAVVIFAIVALEAPLITSPICLL